MKKTFLVDANCLKIIDLLKYIMFLNFFTQHKSENENHDFLLPRAQFFKRRELSEAVKVPPELRLVL